MIENAVLIVLECFDSILVNVQAIEMYFYQLKTLSVTAAAQIASSN